MKPGNPDFLTALCNSPSSTWKRSWRYSQPQYWACFEWVWQHHGTDLMTTVETDPFRTVINIIYDKDSQLWNLNLSQIICNSKSDLPLQNWPNGKLQPVCDKIFFELPINTSDPKFICMNFLPFAELLVWLAKSKMSHKLKKKKQQKQHKKSTPTKNHKQSENEQKSQKQTNKK